ncbi:hypothetical protein JOB18_012154 [Solea senegalensis]|uniref:DUF4708 domain-containing protein n=1 Tax=Solea senegalensis TaxID=28829 RepID=A0AAV6T5E1_SOLSE|nr:hypothetical protein JOB18_012154 [Solea senegalensis]
MGEDEAKVRPSSPAFKETGFSRKPITCTHVTHGLCLSSRGGDIGQTEVRSKCPHPADTMSGGVETSLFFLSLPDLKKLLSVSLSLQEDEDEPRSRQLKICRDLVLLYSDVLVSPALDSFTDITVVMAIPFFQKGILQAFGQRHCLQVGCPQQVSPGVLQCFLSYSLITRLTPRWNKAGRYLISGMELTTTDGHLCLNIETNTVRLPPTTLQDFDLPPSLLKRFWSDPDFVLDPSSTGGTVWCHVLPSMKKGQIITISRQLSGDGPFRTYRDLQNHWNRLPVQRCPRVDLQGVLASFLSDIREQLKSVCGFPAHLTRKPRYCTTTLNSPASSQQQVLSGEQVNLTSTRHVLTHPTPPPPPPPSAHPTVKTLSSLSPKPGLVLTPEMEMKLKSMSSSKPSVKFSSDSSRKQTKQEAPETKPPRPPTSSDIANRDTPLSSRVVKKNRAAAAARDVEKMARNNQLSKLKTLTLLTWLKGRGVVVSAKHKKEELMLKTEKTLLPQKLWNQRS